MSEANLIKAAQAARERAYAPYSGYRVGAAILDSDGAIWTGCNVENVSYSLCVCAERSAVCRMVGEGKRKLLAVAVATRDGGAPCGACLQTLLEFAADPAAVQVIMISESNGVVSRPLNELIPFGFRTDDLGRT